MEQQPISKNVSDKRMKLAERTCKMIRESLEEIYTADPTAAESLRISVFEFMIESAGKHMLINKERGTMIEWMAMLGMVQMEQKVREMIDEGKITPAGWNE